MHVWDTETGELLITIQEENINPYKLSSSRFQIDAIGITATVPNKRLDSPFASQEVLFDINTGGIVGRKDILPTDTRFGDIVWKTGERNSAIVFWNLSDHQAFFVIALMPQGNSRFDLTTFAPIRFSPDGDKLIYSPQIRPWMSRVMF